MNQPDVQLLVRAVTTLWPSVPYRVPVDAAFIRTWHAVLRDVTLDEAERAVLDASRRGDSFPPTPGAIVAAVLAARDVSAGLTVPDTDVAWAELMGAVRTRGFMQGPPEWSHPAVADVARALSWRELCYSNNEGVLRAHFLRLYAPAVARAATQHDEPRELGP